MTYTKQTYEIVSASKPYLFIGSKVRGAFGYALKEEVCVNPTFVCEGCFAAKECLFYSFFEEQNATHNYRLDFKLDSSKYKFSLLLFGDAQEHKESIHKAMMASLSEYKEVAFKEKEKTLKLKKRSKIVKISLITPLRIKKENRFATREIELLDLLLSIHKRSRDIKKLAPQKALIDTSYKVISKQFRYQELTRRSNKQNTKMNLGGLMGEMIVSGVSQEVYDLLKTAEVIGAGKSTVFGLGKIKIEDIG